MNENYCPKCGEVLEEEDLFWEDCNPDTKIVCAEAFCCNCETPFRVRYKVEFLDIVEEK